MVQKKRLNHITHLSKDPVLAEVIARVKLQDLDFGTDHFHALSRSIISQQISTKAALSITEKFKQLYRGKFPSPKQILNTSDEKLKSAGLSGSKVGYIKNLAQFAHTNEKFQKLTEMSDEEIIEILTSIKGIGRWTAEMFLLFALGREDVFSHGDLGLKNAIKKLYKLRKEPSKKRLEQISGKWKPYRSHASRYLWRSLEE